MATYSEVLERIVRGDYDDAPVAERTEAVAKAIQACAVAAAALTVQPVPLLDSALIAPVQIAMVQAIGRVHGHRLDRKSVLEILSTLGASIVAQNAAMAAAKLIPLFGWVVAPSMAYALTWAIGEVSDLYFRSGRGLEPEELRSRFQEVYRAKKAEKEAAHRGDGTLKERLAQLEEAYQAGLIDEAEFSRKKEEVLADF